MALFLDRSRRQSGYSGFERIYVGMVCIAPILFTIAGCRYSNSLQGKVTYNSQPVARGYIDFVSADKKSSGFSVRISEGSYSSAQPRLGKHIAIIRGLQDSKIASKADFIQQREQQNNTHNLPVDYIPEDAPGNGQSVEIVGGKQTLDFAVQGPPRSG